MPIIEREVYLHIHTDASEPTRAEHNGLAVRLLNHSATSSNALFFEIRFLEITI